MKTRAQTTQSGTSKISMSYKKTAVLTIVAGFLLLVTNSALWVNRNIFNAENFTQIVTTSITSESSRTAIAQNITDNIFQDRPIAKRIAGDFTVKIVSGLLDTTQFNSVLATAVERMQVYVTSSDQEDITIELGAVKDILAQLTSVSESLGREVTVDSSNIPDRITLIEEKDVPDLYNVTVVMLWLAPISLVLALVLLVYPYVKKGVNRSHILLMQGIVVTVVSFAGYLIGPLFRPPVLSQVSVENRVVIGNLYDAFIATFNSQTQLVTVSGLLAIVVAISLIGYPYARQSLAKIKK